MTGWPNGRFSSTTSWDMCFKEPLLFKSGTVALKENESVLKSEQNSEQLFMLQI